MLGLLDIDPAAAAPIWRQIEDGMRRLDEHGAVTDADVERIARELARELRINPATVAKAYRRLVDDGVLEVRRGEGTFVAERPAGTLADERKRLLAEGARRYVEAARSMGVTESDAIAAISAAWREITDAADGGKK